MDRCVMTADAIADGKVCVLRLNETHHLDETSE
jgi:hypothetical protein